MKSDTILRSGRSILLIVFLLILFVVPLWRASECRYGFVHAWVRTSDGEWENATAHPLLKRGEFFEIKIIITITTNLTVIYLKLHEFGTPVYEVVIGPTKMEELLELWKPSLQEQSWTFLWKMRVRTNTSWVNGYAPLEVYVQFNKNDTDESSINFDIITAYIIDELSEQYLPEYEDSSSQQKPRSLFLTSRLIGMILMAFVIAIFLRVQQQK